MFYAWPEQENQTRVMLVSHEPQGYHLNVGTTLCVLEKSLTSIYLHQTSRLNFLP